MIRQQKDMYVTSSSSLGKTPVSSERWQQLTSTYPWLAFIAVGMFAGVPAAFLLESNLAYPLTLLFAGLAGGITWFYNHHKHVLDARLDPPPEPQRPQW